MAMARVNSEIEIPVSRVTGTIKTPRLCRIPMLRLSMTEAPIRMGKPDLIRRLVVIDEVYVRHTENPSHFRIRAFSVG
jgi:hypothetical protein